MSFFFLFYVFFLRPGCTNCVAKKSHSRENELWEKKEYCSHKKKMDGGDSEVDG